ncbi:uncharacterized protein LOC129915133 [Episyrphus balteatus]|uniref:uncharacterized protein LOC129915133 n=1 Tax=Episyrphus balteatus TaxID=286459 RepID=UPI002485475C|nr:uncharacterized protein LOC129915133 [Episyrphus balteatus]
MVACGKLILTEIPSVQNKIVECLLRIVSEVDEWMTGNIEINIDATNPIVKDDFINTAVAFRRRINRSTFQMATNIQSESYAIFFRVYFIESLTSLENFNHLHKDHGKKFFPQDHFYIIILPKGIPNFLHLLREIFQIFWKLSMINVNALIEDQDGIVTLYTYFPFKEYRCMDISPEINNRFVNGVFTYKRLHFPNKITNFWKCPLNVIVGTEPPFIDIDNGELIGFDGLLLKQLASVLNFSIKIVRSPSGHVFDNQTFTDGFKLLNDGVGDLMIGDNICTEKRAKYFATSHYNTYHKYIVFRTEISASSLKTLVLPFDLCTWLIILCLSIYKWFAKFLWETISKKPIGHRTGTYNWFILGPYVASFLIIRSLYEGSVFKIFHQRPIGVRPNSFDEAIQQGYKFMATTETYSLNSGIPELKNNIVFFNTSDLMETFFETEGKYAFFASKEHMSIYSKGRMYFLAKKPLLTRFTCMFMTRLSYMTSEFNNKIDQLRTHGHVDKIYSLFFNIKVPSAKESSKTQAYFSIKQLMGAFHFYCISISVSSLIFIFEMYLRLQ